MKEIVDLPFWLVYTASHIVPVFCLSCLFCIAITVVLFSVSFCCFDEDKRLGKIGFALSAVTAFLSLLFGSVASLAPSRDEFKAYVAVKVCKDISETEVVAESQKVILQWLDNKFDELGQETK